jgi:hypothetical protein
VYSSCHQANSAHDAFRKFLKPYKKDASDGELSRENIHALVEEARRYVVRELGIVDDGDDSLESSRLR